MKVYICPECGWLREVSRRKEVNCFKCGCDQMALTKLTYEQYADMDMEARKNYSGSWMYIHRKE